MRAVAAWDAPDMQKAEQAAHERRAQRRRHAAVAQRGAQAGHRGRRGAPDLHAAALRLDACQRRKHVHRGGAARRGLRATPRRYAGAFLGLCHDSRVGRRAVGRGGGPERDGQRRRRRRGRRRRERAEDAQRGRAVRPRARRERRLQRRQQLLPATQALSCDAAGCKVACGTVAAGTVFDPAIPKYLRTVDACMPTNPQVFVGTAAASAASASHPCMVQDILKQGLKSASHGDSHTMQRGLIICSVCGPLQLAGYNTTMPQRGTVQPGTRARLQLCRRHREPRPVARRTRDISRGDGRVRAAPAACGRQAQRGGTQRAQRGGRAPAQRARERRQRLAVQEQRVAVARHAARRCAACPASVSALACVRAHWRSLAQHGGAAPMPRASARTSVHGHAGTARRAGMARRTRLHGACHRARAQHAPAAQPDDTPCVRRARGAQPHGTSLHKLHDNVVSHPPMGVPRSRRRPVQPRARRQRAPRRPPQQRRRSARLARRGARGPGARPCGAARPPAASRPAARPARAKHQGRLRVGSRRARSLAAVHQALSHKQSPEPAGPPARRGSPPRASMDAPGAPAPATRTRAAAGAAPPRPRQGRRPAQQPRPRPRPPWRPARPRAATRAPGRARARPGARRRGARRAAAVARRRPPCPAAAAAAALGTLFVRRGARTTCAACVSRWARPAAARSTRGPCARQRALRHRPARAHGR